MTHGHVKPNPDGSKARCGGPAICPDCALELQRDVFEHREGKLVDLILEWQFNWMDVRGTDEKDADNYRRRASGIDANMRYDLARRILNAGFKP